MPVCWGGKEHSNGLLVVVLKGFSWFFYATLGSDSILVFFLGVNEVDYSLYPNRKLQEQWLRSYLEAYKEYKGFGTVVSGKEVEVLYVQVNQFALVSIKYLIKMF